MPVAGASGRIEQTLRSWEGLEVHPHRFGGLEFRLGKREIGHIHGDSLVDIPFPPKIRDALIEAQLAEPHHILPESGWISRWLRQPADLETALQLLRRSYELALAQKARHAARSGEEGFE